MDEYMGVVKMFAGNFAPRGYAFCQGQLLPIAQYQALFSILGVTYGGDGRTTFALPNLNGRVPVGTGQSSGGSQYSLGQDGGVESVTLTQVEMPAHTHGAQVNVSANEATTNNPIGKVPGAAEVQVERSGPKIPVNAYADASTGAASPDSTTILSAGGNQPHNNMQPYLGLNYIICMEGVYPPRS